jgi:hypothetical protein
MAKEGDIFALEALRVVKEGLMKFWEEQKACK